MLLLISLPAVLYLLLYLIIFLCVVLLFHWVINQLAPEPLRRILTVVLIAVACIVLLLYVIQFIGGPVK